MKNKREIKGIKDTNKNYTGHTNGIIKKIIALLLSAGIIITAAEAIELYNKWRASRTQDIEASQQEKIKQVSFEEVKQLVEEYREAISNNDTEKISSLESKLHEGNYFETLYGIVKTQAVESLGLDPEKVEVFTARDGIFLIDREKAKDRMRVDHTGQINPGVKYIAQNGKKPSIPSDMKKIISSLGDDKSAARYKRMDDLEAHYSNYEYLVEYELEIDERE